MAKKDNKDTVKDVVRLRRTAGEVKKYALLTRGLSLLVIILIALIAIAYAIAYFYDKFGKISLHDQQLFELMWVPLPLRSR